MINMQQTIRGGFVFGDWSCRAGLLCILLFTNSIGIASEPMHWPEFRGPTGDGQAGSPGLPATWSESENVKWKTEIPGRGWSSPVVWEDQVWLTTSTPEGRELSAYCLDRSTGAVRFARKLLDVKFPSAIEKFNSYASPTPAIKAGRVYLSYGGYGLVCLDTSTFETLWIRRDLECEHYQGAGASPMLAQDLLYLHYDGIDQQYVVALDQETGDTVWKTRRPHNFQTTSFDEKKCYATPQISVINGRRELISPSSKGVFSYDPDTGREFWRIRFDQFSTAWRPLYGDGLLLVGTGWRYAAVLGIRPADSGDLTETNIVWSQPKQMPCKPSGILHDGLLTVVNDSGIASCLDARTGEVVWQKRIGGNFSASPILADGRLFLFDEGGKGVVIAAGREYQEIATNVLDEGCLASPAVVGRSLFVRTRTHLYCLEDSSRRTTPVVDR